MDTWHKEVVEQNVGVDRNCTDSFLATIGPYRDFLRQFGMRLTRNVHDAEDLLQEVLLKLFANRDKLASIQTLQPWLARVMYYQHIDQHRRHPQQAFVSIDQLRPGAGNADEGGSTLHWDLADDGPGPDETVQGEEVSALVQRALKQLPAGLRHLVLLHDIQGLSLPALSLRMGISVNTLKSSLKRARRAMRQSLCALAPDAALARCGRTALQPPPIAAPPSDGEMLGGRRLGAGAAGRPPGSRTSTAAAR